MWGIINVPFLKFHATEFTFCKLHISNTIINWYNYIITIKWIICKDFTSLVPTSCIHLSIVKHKLIYTCTCMYKQEYSSKIIFMHGYLAKMSLHAVKTMIVSMSLYSSNITCMSWNSNLVCTHFCPFPLISFDMTRIMLTEEDIYDRWTCRHSPKVQ